MAQHITNITAAQQEAERRWGRMARAWIIAGVRFVSADTTSTVGPKWLRFDGHGPTWDASFHDADKEAR